MSTKSRKRKQIERKAKRILSGCMKHDNQYALWQQEILKSMAKNINVDVKYIGDEKFMVRVYSND